MPVSLNSGSHALFVCEGTFEQVTTNILKDANAFVVPSSHIIDVTRLRRASQILLITRS